MAEYTLSPSNPSRRRTLFGGAAAIITGTGITPGTEARQIVALAQAEPEPAAAPSTIAAMASRIKTIVDRENFLDSKRLGNLSAEEDAEDASLYDERMALQDAIVATAPTNSTEALIVMMYATDRIELGICQEDGLEITKRAERAVRGALFVLSRELDTSLVPFGAENFLPAYMCPLRSGRA